MSTTDEEVAFQYEEVDVNIVPDQYVTWIVDLWRGDKRDPATAITRYIAVWRADQLENEQGEGVDPTFKPAASYRRQDPVPVPQPMVWNILEKIKEPDQEAEKFRTQQENLMNRELPRYGSTSTRASLYQAFMDALDVLAHSPDDQEAWAKVEAYRNNQALEYER
jgi:hypothetical protein